MTIFRKLLRNRDGATAVEYGLIAALIVIGAITAIQGLGTQVKSSFSRTSSSMAS